MAIARKLDKCNRDLAQFHGQYKKSTEEVKRIISEIREQQGQLLVKNQELEQKQLQQESKNKELARALASAESKFKSLQDNSRRIAELNKGIMDELETCQEDKRKTSTALLLREAELSRQWNAATLATPSEMGDGDAPLKHLQGTPTKGKKKKKKKKKKKRDKTRRR